MDTERQSTLPRALNNCLCGVRGTKMEEQIAPSAQQEAGENETCEEGLDSWEAEEMKTPREHEARVVEMEREEHPIHFPCLGGDVFS